MSLASDSASPYSPIRQRSTRWWDYAMRAAKHQAVTLDGRIAASLPMRIEQDLVLNYVRDFHALMKDSPNLGELMCINYAKVSVFRHWVPLIAQYELAGRQIFDLHDALADMLTHTDLGECTLEGWNPPYEAFYVRFGKQDSMSLPFEDNQREYLDGAFVARTPYEGGGHRLKFGFTTVHEDGSGVQLPGYFVDLIPSEQRMTLPDAIEASLARRLAMYDAEDNSPDADKETAAINSYRRAEARESIELLKAGATLLVNSLFYLENLGSTALPEPGPGRDTPSDRVVLWHQVASPKRHKQKASLTSDGYAIVRLVGSEVADTFGRAAAGSVRPHWRRGHWRWQAYGVALALRKRILIKPVMVGAAEHDGTPLPGHIYMAGPGGVQ